MTNIKRGVVVTLVLVGIIGAVELLRMVTPSAEAVRVRNSLIFEVVDLGELEWTPARYPGSFKLDSTTPPQLFQDAAAQIQGAADDQASRFDLALAIGRQLAVGRVKGGAIQADTATTYSTILREGTGYCADFTQVFNGLAHASALPVREWGMSFDGFGGKGHAFNEIFDEGSQKWFFIDTFYSFYVVDRSTSVPLSALDFRERLKDRAAWNTVRIVPISETRFGFKSELAALEYYHRGVNEFYMWWGNNVFEYDDSLPVRWASKVSRSVEQAVAILAGVHPRIRIPTLPGNESAIESLTAVKGKFVFVVFIEIVAWGTLLGMVAASILRRSRGRRSRSLP